MLQTETVFRTQTSVLRYVSSGKRRWPISPVALCSTYDQCVSGLFWLRGHCCLAGGLRSWKPTPNVFSLAEKADLAGRSPVCTGPGNPPIAS